MYGQLHVLKKFLYGWCYLLKTELWCYQLKTTLMLSTKDGTLMLSTEDRTLNDPVHSTEMRPFKFAMKHNSWWRGPYGCYMLIWHLERLSIFCGKY